MRATLFPLLIVATHAVAAPPDFCTRQIEGATLEMSYDAVKAEWARRGYQDVSPAALPGGRPNTRLALDFSKNGGANFMNPGGQTLSWRAAEAGGPMIQLAESGTATAALGAGGWSNGQRFLDRQAEFCSTASPDVQCDRTRQSVRIDVKSPLRPDNTQCAYTIFAASQTRRTMVSESISRVVESPLTQRKMDVFGKKLK
jgi:hypothetical protein